MAEVRELTAEEFEREVASAVPVVPIEQTSAWAAYQAKVPGRTPFAYVVVSLGGRDMAYASLVDYETHGYHYLRSHHGPAWVEAPTAKQEREALEALIAYVRGRDRRQKFLRIAVDHELDLTRPTLSSIPYDTTVVVDLTGGDEEILARMKPRGRRDVRKALREAPVECADETDRALESFADYYAVMAETAERDGFAPAPISDYEDMLRSLGPEHCRVYAGRLEDGRVATWSLDTISGTHATRYYAASLSETMRLHVTDKLMYVACCELARRGCTEYDLMAIGSDFCPELKGLNEFKCKFAKDVAHVAPDRDVPVDRAFYSLLGVGKRVLDVTRG